MEEMLRHMNEIYKVILKLKDKLQDEILNLHSPNMLRDTIQQTKLLEIEMQDTLQEVNLEAQHVC